MCDIVCEGAPQEQDGSEAWFQRTRLAAHRPCPVRKWFNVDYKRRRRSNPGGAMEGSTINERFTTSEAAHFSVHFWHGDTSSCCDSSSHTGCRDVRRASGWDSMSDIRGRVTVEDLILLRSWFVAAIRRMWGGVMWLRTKNETLRHFSDLALEMIRILLRRATLNISMMMTMMMHCCLPNPQSKFDELRNLSGIEYTIHFSHPPVHRAGSFTTPPVLLCRVC